MNSIAALLVLAAVAAEIDLSAFSTLPPDPPPTEITRGSHYWIGNEDRLDVFYETLKNRGGVHVGVGAEQNWIFIGWSKPQAAVLMDFDQAIVDLQRVYLIAFEAAVTKEDFRKLWFDKSRKGLRAGILAKYPGKQNAVFRAGALHALDVARWSIERRLLKLEAFFQSKGIPWFLTDDESYAACRTIVLAGHASAVRGDLTAQNTMRAIGAAAHHAGLPVRSLYLSNAEQYFKYSKQVRANFLSLPVDENSVVVRTNGSKQLSFLKGGGHYHYQVQSGPSFLAFLQDAGIQDVRQILAWAPEEGEHGFSRLTSVDVTAARTQFEERQRDRRADRAAQTRRRTTAR